MSELGSYHLQMRQRALLASLPGRGVTVLHCDSDGRCDMAEGLPAVWPGAPVGRSWTDGLPADAAAIIDEASDRLSRTSETQTAEFHLGEGADRRILVASLVPDGDGVIAIITDVSETRRREAAFAALLREVSHRSKNLLAIVQSVAMQTANHSGTVGDFLDKFRGRLHALSSTQDLVTDSDWRGTSLHTLVAAQLRRVDSSTARNIDVIGDNPVLTPNAALHVGLAIHELAANAVAYGALSRSAPGKVRIVTSSVGDHLIVEWSESFPPRETASEPRFGTLILERIVPLSVGGRASYARDAQGVTYRLEVPAGEFEA